MTIDSADELISALGNNTSRFVYDKVSVSSMVAGQICSLFVTAGTPAGGTAPTTAVVPTNATVGAIGFANQTAPATSYLGWLWAVFGNATTALELHDRLAHMGGLSGTVITAQGALSLVTTDPGADRIGAADYSDVSWFLEVYTSLGGTSVAATVGVTYDDNSTGNLAAFGLGTTPRSGRLYPLLPAVPGRWIKAVTSVTLSATTGTAGNFGITATRQRTLVAAPVANWPTVADWAQLGMPEIPNNACLFGLVTCTTTTTGTIRGQGKIVHG